MAKKLKVGVVGLGTIGTIHAESYKKTDQAQLEAFCDIDAPRLNAKSDRFGVKQRFGDYRELMKTDIDAVSVCVGNSLHLEVSIAALEAGKHVLLEKPMAINAAEGEKIIAAEKASGRVLQIGMVRRQFPEAQIVRRYVEEGLLGDIYHMRTVMIRRRGIPGMGGWFTTKAESGGGPMIDLGVHCFDIAMWLSGQWKPTAVSAKNYAKFGPIMENYKYVSMWAGPPKFDGVFDVEDYTTGFVRFGDAATLGFDISWAANTTEQGFVEILGDKGGARLFSDKPMEIFTENQGNIVNISPQYDSGVDPFEREAASFLAACRGDAPPAATGAEGVVVMKLIDAIYASSDTGREVAIHA